MAHHAFFAEGKREDVIEAARGYAARCLSLTGADNPDIQIFTFGLLSVDDARRVTDAAYQSGSGSQKLIVVYAIRLFHEAQNALLKVLEEPPEGVTIILGVPTRGSIISTLNSRLLPLPSGDESSSMEGAAAAFLALTTPEREKYITKLIDRSKADKDEVKQEARGEAGLLLRELTSQAYARYHSEQNPKIRSEFLHFIEDLSAFTPLMYERSTPLKLIFEHILLVIPKELGKAKV